MRFLVLFQLIFSVVASLFIGFYYSTHSAVGFAAGAGLGLFNILALIFTWTQIFEKKLVALAIGVIVFKFAILGWIIYEVVTKNLVHIGWFSAGLGVVILSTTATALATSQQYTQAQTPEKAE